MKSLILILIVFWANNHAHLISSELEPLSKEMVEFVNNHPKSAWQAAPSTHFQTVSNAMMRLGAMHEPKSLKLTRRPTKFYSGLTKLPDSFDARTHWPNCPSIGQIRDQSSCGSCWAFGAVEAMTDRVCIHSNATINVELSARDLLSCATACSFGCSGGFPPCAWEYWLENGVVSGGSFENPTGCQPYPFPACEHHTTGKRPPCKGDPDTPACLHVCEPGYNNSYEEDKHFGSLKDRQSYSRKTRIHVSRGQQPYNVDSDEQAIMEELMTNGPIEVGFTVYADFLNYKSGIYHHLAGRQLGGHAIKLLGWGTENGIKFWLLANSWNTDWGENGYFRMKRGVDECGIESEGVAALPDFDRQSRI